MSRYTFFAFAILIGLAAGLYYGWEISPVRVADTSPEILRADYRSDYVLMVAEAYQSEGNPEVALERLAFFPDTNPLQSIRTALQFGLDNGYTADDLANLNALNEAVRAYDPSLELTPAPE